jgi:hypothetical protein
VDGTNPLHAGRVACGPDLAGDPRGVRGTARSPAERLLGHTPGDRKVPTDK